MGRLVHIGLGSSSPVAHVLHYPPSPRKQLCNRYCSNKHTDTPASPRLFSALSSTPSSPRLTASLCLLLILMPPCVLLGERIGHKLLVFFLGSVLDVSRSTPEVRVSNTVFWLKGGERDNARARAKERESERERKRGRGGSG